jgi:MFS family permease
MQTATLSSGFVVEAADRQEKRRRAISGAVFSEFIDMFDIYLPTVVLSPVLFYFQPARLDPGEQAIFASLVFITTLLGRPIGALAFGVVADCLGRRMASITSVAGFGVITFLIALIPGYAQIGIASYWLLVILRFLDGICLGGGLPGLIRSQSNIPRKSSAASPAASSSPPFPPLTSPSRSSPC